MDFKIAIEQDEDGWFIVTFPGLPGGVSQGKTEEKAKKKLRKPLNCIFPHSPVMASRSITAQASKKHSWPLIFDG